jgi:hypothetical protein
MAGALTGKTHERLVDESSGLNSLARPLASHVPRSNAT